MNWYYAQNSQRHGPVSENEFDFLVHQKKILPGMLVWNETMPDWRPLREVQPEPPPLPPAFDWAQPQPPPLDAVIERNGPAWEERDNIGGLNAAARTVVELLRERREAFQRMKLTGGWLGPFCFALFMGGLGVCASLIYSIVFTRLGLVTVKGSEGLLATNTGVIFLAIFCFFFFPFFITGVLLLNSILIHFTLTILGGAKEPFEATWRVVTYSFGASSIFQFIPMFGGLVAFVWNLMLMVTGIASVHKISAGKAAVCIAPILLYMGLLLALMIEISTL